MTNPTPLPAPAPEAEAAPGTSPCRRARRRAGFSILEAQVAFVLLGIGLAGVCPLIVMQVKLSKRVATGFDQNGRFQHGGRTYLTPAPERWARKLGAAARLSTSAAEAAAPAAEAEYKVRILDPVSRPYGSESILLRIERVQSKTNNGNGNGVPGGGNP